MRLGVAVAAVCLSVVGLAVADDVRASIRKPTKIPPEDLASALQTLAKDRNFQVVYVSEEVNNLRTQGAVGEFTPDEALKQLLKGTGLTYRYLDDKTVTVLRVSSSAQSSTPPTSPATPGSTSPPDDQAQKGGGSFWNRFRVAQVHQGRTSGAVSVDKQEEEASKKKPILLEEVVVTGSRIPQYEKQGAELVRVYSVEDIQASGRTTVADFLNTLPDVSISSVEGGIQTLFGQTTVQLHGLPKGTTLILLNGRRVETSFYSFFDLGNIPVSAIDRIEVLPVGSSAVYGSDALAGTVNIILRQDMDGFEGNAKYGHADGSDESDLNIGWGIHSDRGSVSIVGNYQSRSALLGAGRAITSNSNPAPGTSSFAISDACYPGTVYSLTGQNLPGLTSTHAGIPPGLSGTPTQQSFAATAGSTNNCNAVARQDLIPPTAREGMLASGHYEFTEVADGFFEVLVAHEHQNVRVQDLITLQSYLGYTVGAANPYNPFGQAVGIGYSYPGIGTGEDNSQTFIRTLAGIRGTLSSEWHYELSALMSQDESNVGAAQINSTVLQQALNSPDPTTAFNPFASGAPGTSAVLQKLESTANPAGDHLLNRVLSGQAVLRGPVAQLPAGPLQSVIGAEYDRYTQNTQLLVGSATGQPEARLSRNAYAAFTEERVPILADRTRSTNSTTLALTVAGRYDKSNDYGSKTTGQGGMEWRPFGSLLVRGSYAQAYSAPQLQELSGAAIANFPSFVVDPFRGNMGTLVPTAYGATNANLKPETGRSRSLGVAYSPHRVTGAEASLTYFTIDVSNYIAIINAQTLVNNSNLFPGGVVRSAPSASDIQLGYLGPITSINEGYFNFGHLSLSGVDLDLRYRIDTNLGKFAPFVSVTETTKWDSALTPNAPSKSYLAQATLSGPGFAPRLKGVIQLPWSRGAWAANVSGRYVGHYKDYQDYGPSNIELGDLWLFDANLRFTIENESGSGHRWLNRAYFEVGGVNILNRLPQNSANYYGYDPAEADIRGRFIYAQVGARF